MNYSTLKEAYNIERFSQKREKVQEPFMNDYSVQDNCYYKNEYAIDTKVCNNGKSVSKFTNPKSTPQQILQKKEYTNLNPANIETSKLAYDSTEVSGYQSNQMNKMGNSCSPLQAPSYEYPVSNECKKEFQKTMTTYTNDHTINNMPYEEYNADSKMKDIQSYYDEDLEQYFDINNVTNEVNYNSSNPNKPKIPFMSNMNNLGYANDNTNEYRNLKDTEGDNLLKTKEYNLSDEDRKNALHALSVLKDIEDKINTSKNTSKDTSNNKLNVNETKNNTIFTTLINIGLFIFIGIVIILLCDQLVELAIQIGMKKAVNILQPYINNQIPQIPQMPQLLQVNQ